MYHSLLANRYLTGRVIPLIASGAVALCVALVIVVVSVMTGFLDMVQSAGRTLTGDVIVTYGVSGIPHYEDLAARIEASDEADSATPIVDGWGLLRMPYPDRDAKQSKTVQVWGIEPASFAAVTGFADTLSWKTASANQLDWLLLDAVRNNLEAVLAPLDAESRVAVIDALNDAAVNLNFRSVGLQESLRGLLDDAQWAAVLDLDPRLSDEGALHAQSLAMVRGGLPGIVAGLHVSDGNERQKDGTYSVVRNDFWWLPRYDGTLTMLPIDNQGGVIEPESRIMPFVNEFQSGVFLIDETRVFVPIGVAQELLHLDAAQLVAEDDPTIIVGIDPARATSILVRAADGVTPEALRDRVSAIYEAFHASHVEAMVAPPSSGDPGLSIHTWREQQQRFTGPVEKERELMRTLFSIVYLVCAALILSIFWAIVFEKTRDIGILRSLGASRAGITWIFLRYGLVIGAIGALLGLCLGWLVTGNINVLHQAMGDPPVWAAIVTFALALAALGVTIHRSRRGDLLPIVLGGISIISLCLLGGAALWIRAIGGLVIWDPSVYYFSVIPNQLDWPSAWVTVAGAILFCLLGALVPAAKAADTDPVEALRHE